jgi:hypothetical protein
VLSATNVNPDTFDKKYGDNNGMSNAPFYYKEPTNFTCV